MTTIAIVDTETTGLKRTEGDRVTEVATVVVRCEGKAWHPLATLSLVCNPGPEAMARWDHPYGPPKDLVAAAPSEDWAAKRLRNWLTGWGVGRWTSFNVEFDGGFLEHPPWSIAVLRAPCVMLAAFDHARAQRNVRFPWRRANGDMKWPRLEEAARWLDIEQLVPAHRALPDVLVAAEVARVLYERGAWAPDRGMAEGVRHATAKTAARLAPPGDSDVFI